MWYDKVIDGLADGQIINDSKTPSGRVHVGSLRGVLIHDAVYRALKDNSVEAVYRYGVDDYDPLDGLPADAAPELQQYMGMPLCNVPAPEGSSATDMADHYISEFLALFSELEVGAEIYRMRDIYRSGQFNEAIDTLLKKSDVVRKVYKEVSKADRPDDWHPFQVICEQCGKVGTTEVGAYDGKEVTYTCKEDLVNWATGCGHKGKISPFDGNGKLPWKLEWVAKWHHFGITIEGAGKDHCTKGGSRDVAARCLKEIFGGTPPLNVPYEFFLVSGAKMSSSKGVGTAAREMANFLPPEILRFLMIKTPPKRTVNFSTDFDYVVKLFNEHDRLLEANLAGRTTADQQNLLRTIQIDTANSDYRPIGFQLLTALLQLPHIDVEEAIETRMEGGLTAENRKNLQARIVAAQYWLDHYASEDDRVVLQETLPNSAAALSETQKAFLHRLGKNFPTDELGENAYQSYIFDIARTTPISQKEAFAALYCVLLDKPSGPKGGALFSYLERDFLIKHFTEVEYSRHGLWAESSMTMDECKAWCEKQASQIIAASAQIAINTLTPSKGKAVAEISATLSGEKKHLLRIALGDFETETTGTNGETKRLQALGNAFIAELVEAYQIALARADELTVYDER